MVLTKTKKRTTKIKQLWSFEKDGLTFSALSTWLRCREQFRLSYVCGYSYPGFVTYLEFGNLFHYLLEHWTDKSDLSKLISKFKKKYWGPDKRRKLAQKDIDSMASTFGSVAAVFPQYLKFHEKEDSQYRWLEREGSFNFTINVDGVDILIRGKTDGVREKKKKKEGGRRVFESKTKGRFNEVDLGDALLFDHQTMLYSIPAEKKYGGIEGVRYNVIRRPQLMQRKKETLVNFLKRIEDDVITRPDHYFKRWTIDFPKGSMEEWKETQLKPILRNFLLWYKGFSPIEKIITDPFSNPLHYKGFSDSLYIKNAKTHLYKMLTTGSDKTLEIRDKVHPELEEE